MVSGLTDYAVMSIGIIVKGICGIHFWFPARVNSSSIQVAA